MFKKILTILLIASILVSGATINNLTSVQIAAKTDWVDGNQVWNTDLKLLMEYHKPLGVAGKWIIVGTTKTINIDSTMTVDNIQLSTNTISTTAGTDFLLTPLAGQQLILDGHWQIDANALTALTDNNTTITGYAGKNVTVESVTFDGGVVAGVGNLTVDNLNVDGNAITSTTGDITVTPLAGEDFVVDAHWEFDGPALAALTDNNTIITGYAGKNVTVESVTFDGGVVAGVGNLTVDNLNVDGNAITSTAGDITVTPLAGEDVVIDGHFEFDGAALTALTDNNTVITGYAGKNVTVESVAIDGGVVTGVGNLTVDNLNVDGNAITSTAGDITVTPLAGEDIVLDGHLEIDGAAIGCLTDNNTVVTAYAGKNITVESVTFDGGIVAGVTSVTADTVKHEANVYSIVKTSKKTIGHPGETTTDLTWTSAENTTEQTINADTIPAYAHILDVMVVCTEAITGITTSFTVDVGDGAGTDEFCAATDLKAANSLIAGDNSEAFIVQPSATQVIIYVNGTPNAENWSAMTAGEWSVLTTYIDYGNIK